MNLKACKKKIIPVILGELLKYLKKPEGNYACLNSHAPKHFVSKNLPKFVESNYRLYILIATK